MENFDRSRAAFSVFEIKIVCLTRAWAGWHFEIQNYKMTSKTKLVDYDLLPRTWLESLVGFRNSNDVIDMLLKIVTENPKFEKWHLEIIKPPNHITMTNLKF